MVSFSFWSSPGFVPAGVMVMRLAEYENVKSLTMLEPMVLLNFPRTTRPGCDHDCPIGPRLLFPQPKPPSGGPSCQESLVKRIMARRVLVRLMSPRALSSRQNVGTPKDFVKLLAAHGSDVVGSG